MAKNYETELPDGYSEAMVVDAKEKKLSVILNISAILIMVLTVVIVALSVKPRNFFENFSQIRNLIFLSAMILYIILHELTHGLIYKVMTGRKLKFGLTLSVAYCGVPDIYVYRKTAVSALIAPFLIFLPIFLLAVILFGDPWNKMYAAILLGMHLGGCSGDIYDLFLYLFRFKSPDTLMRDTGPKQTFYTK